MNHLHVWPLPDTHQLMLIVLQSAFRKYLTEKGVIATKDWIPVQAPLTQVQAFNRDGNSLPTIDNITIDWNSPLKTSPWNQETMCLLAADFHTKVKMGTYPTVTYDASCMSIDVLNHICTQKLFWTHQVCQQQAMIDSYPEEQQQDTILKHATI